MRGISQVLTYNMGKNQMNDSQKNKRHELTILLLVNLGLSRGIFNALRPFSTRNEWDEP